MTEDGIDTYDRTPWERQPGEPWKYYDIFRHYRDSGPSTSLSEAYRVYKDDPDATVTQTVREKSKDWKWDDRAERYYAHEAKLAEKSTSMTLRQRKQQQAAVFRQFQNVFERYLEEHFNELPLEQQMEKLDELNMKEMIQAFSLASEGEREALGDNDSDDSAKDVFKEFIQAAEELRDEKEVVEGRVVEDG